MEEILIGLEVCGVTHSITVGSPADYFWASHLLYRSRNATIRIPFGGVNIYAHPERVSA
jgi:hypothetical protein